jgi:uncharacterized repeat protein (TIGR03843 family)
VVSVVEERASEEKALILEALQKGTFDLQGQFLSGSNYTFLGDLEYGKLAFQVVYKPARGEQPLWDFPHGSLARREVAAFLVSEAMGLNMVPPTILRKEGPLGPGSLQQYIEHDPNDHYFNFEERDRQRLRPVVVFDLILNNADRKGGHIIRDYKDCLWLIDHGLCFHAEEKLRTVVWDFSGEEIPRDIMAAVSSLIGQLKEGEKLQVELLQFLRSGEILAMMSRARRLCETGRFPSPPASRRSYPWPPV